MFQVVVYSPLVLLQQGVGVAEAVTGLSLHHLVPQLPGQLQRFPKEEETTASVYKSSLKGKARENIRRGDVITQLYCHFSFPPLEVRLSSPVVLCGGVELAQEYQGIAKVTVGSPLCRFVPKFFGYG